MLRFNSLPHPEDSAVSVFGLQCAGCGTITYLPVDPNDDVGRGHWVAMREGEGWQHGADQNFCPACAPLATQDANWVVGAA